MRYKQSFDRYIQAQGHPIKSLVAFSGTVQDDRRADVTYTEEGMNHGIREKELPEKFTTPEYQVLLVAEKYQTGFDQPLLHTMYVDKRPVGMQAVQTLLRLNRIHPLKEDTFVLDFVNDREEICESQVIPYQDSDLERRGIPATRSLIRRPIRQQDSGHCSGSCVSLVLFGGREVRRWLRLNRHQQSISPVKTRVIFVYETGHS